MFINIYFSSYLAENIDSFVKVYNHIKNNSFFCLFSIKNEYIVSASPRSIVWGWSIWYFAKAKNYFFITLHRVWSAVKKASAPRWTEIKFINILMLNLKFYSLNISPIIIDLFTFSILLAFMVVTSLLLLISPFLCICPGSFCTN